MRTHLKLKKYVAWQTFRSALKLHPSSTSFVRKPQTNESRTFAEIGKSTNPNTRSSQQKPSPPTTRNVKNDGFEDVEHNYWLHEVLHEPAGIVLHASSNRMN